MDKEKTAKLPMQMRDERLAVALDHWAQCFWDGSVYDDFAEEIALILSDEAKRLRSNYK